MNVRVTERDGTRLLECVEPITRVDDALSLVTACIENRAERLLVEAQQLPAAFFDLKTRFAGEFIQKLQNYHIRLAVVFPTAATQSERFEQFLVEAKRGQQFRACMNRNDAEAWLSAD